MMPPMRRRAPTPMTMYTHRGRPPSVDPSVWEASPTREECETIIELLGGGGVLDGEAWRGEAVDGGGGTAEVTTLEGDAEPELGGRGDEAGGRGVGVGVGEGGGGGGGELGSSAKGDPFSAELSLH